MRKSCYRVTLSTFVLEPGQRLFKERIYLLDEENVARLLFFRYLFIFYFFPYHFLYFCLDAIHGRVFSICAVVVVVAGLLLLLLPPHYFL